MKPKSKAKLYGAVAVFVIVLLAGALYFSNLPVPKTASIVNSISLANYGSVKDGKLTGAKYLISATLSPSDADILISLKGSQQNFGNYVVTPQKNMLIKMKSQGSYATAGMESYPVSYYSPTYSQTLQLSVLKGTATWDYRTPYIVNVYIDSDPVPSTLTDSKYINEIGQSLMPISDGVQAQQSSIAFIGSQDLPRPDGIVVATAPEYQGINQVAPSYKAGIFIFSKSDFDTKINNFYTNYGSRTLVVLNEPAQALWTGYDHYRSLGFGICSGVTGLAAQSNGYCKLSAWNGLYQEVSRPNYDISYDAQKNNLSANNIQYSSNINLEIASEKVETLAILRGVGDLEIVSVDIPDSIRADTTYKQMVVTVKNRGDTDGANIQPISKSGKLIFTPASYTSYQIESGKTATFTFMIAVAGKETGEVSAKEDAVIEVRANNNPTKLTKAVQFGIEYSPQPPGQPTGITPKSTSTIPKTNPVTGTPWYEQWYTFVLLGLGILLIYFIYDGTKKKK